MLLLPAPWTPPGKKPLVAGETIPLRGISDKEVCCGLGRLEQGPTAGGTAGTREGSGEMSKPPGLAPPYPAELACPLPAAAAAAFAADAAAAAADTAALLNRGLLLDRRGRCRGERQLVGPTPAGVVTQTGEDMLLFPCPAPPVMTALLLLLTFVVVAVAMFACIPFMLFAAEE